MVKRQPSFELVREVLVAGLENVADVCEGEIAVAVIVVALDDEAGLVYSQWDPEGAEALHHILNAQIECSVLGWVEEAEADDGVEVRAVDDELRLHPFELLLQIILRLEQAYEEVFAEAFHGRFVA